MSTKNTTSVQISKKTHKTLRLLGKVFVKDSIDEIIIELIKYITIEQTTKITIRNLDGKIIDIIENTTNTADFKDD